MASSSIKRFTTFSNIFDDDCETKKFFVFSHTLEADRRRRDAIAARAHLFRRASQTRKPVVLCVPHEPQVRVFLRLGRIQIY